MMSRPLAFAGGPRHWSTPEGAESRVERAVTTVFSFFELVSRRVKKGVFVAQLVVQDEVRIDDEGRRELGADFIARATQLMVQGGWVEVEPGKRYVRRFPLVGLVRVGKRGYRTDEQGLLRLPSLPATTDLADVVVYQERSGERPFLVLPKLELVPAGETPTPSMVTVPRSFPKEQ